MNMKMWDCLSGCCSIIDTNIKTAGMQFSHCRQLGVFK